VFRCISSTNIDNYHGIIDNMIPKLIQGLDNWNFIVRRGTAKVMVKQADSGARTLKTFQCVVDGPFQDHFTRALEKYVSQLIHTLTNIDLSGSISDFDSLAALYKSR
jgi:hypothetical protein